MAPLILMIVGALVAIGSFIFAAINMGRLGGKRGFNGLFTGHIGAMIGMAIGGLAFWAGAIWGIVLLILKFVPAS